MTGQVILRRKDRDASLASWINTTMNALQAAQAEGLAAYVDWPADACPSAYGEAAAFARCPNMFEWYFEQPALARSPGDGCPVWIYEDMQAMVVRHQAFERRHFYPRHLRPNAAVLARLQALLERHAIDPARTIAVAWRGTDNVVDGRTRRPITDCYAEIDALLDADPGLSIVAKPEEQDAADALCRRYPQALVPPEFFLAPPGSTQMQDRINPAPGFERGMQPVLLMLLYARCRFLLKNSANLADCAAWMSSGRVCSMDSGIWF